MDILIVANFCMDFSENENGRFSYIANMLAENNSVEIVTSDFYHITKKHRTKLPCKEYKITLLHEPGYCKNVCLKRFGSHFIWGKNVKKYLRHRKVPDMIYCAVPSLTGSYFVSKYAKSKGIRFVIDIQDLWPEAFKMVFNIPVISNILFWPFKFMADSIYKQANVIIGVSQTYVNRALQASKKCSKGYVVFLGTKLNVFDKYTENNLVKKEKNEIWLGYCGTLGSSYDLNSVIDALERLKDKSYTLIFIVMGDGPKKEEFEKYSQLKKINARFLGRISYDKMCGILKMCDIAVNPISHGAAQSIINKHADYAAAGLPVVNTQENKEYRELVEQYTMGYNCKNGDVKDLAKKIDILASDEKKRRVMGKNARRCAVEKFDRTYTYAKISELIG